jgi:Sec-independent protein translocase protein TatA
VFSLDPEKVLVVLLVALVVLGPDKLPRAARQAGAAWSQLRQWRTRLEHEVRGSFPDLPDTSALTDVVRSPLKYLDRLADEHTPATGSVVTEGVAATVTLSEATATSASVASASTTGGSVFGTGAVGAGGTSGSDGTFAPGGTVGIGGTVAPGGTAAPDGTVGGAGTVAPDGPVAGGTVGTAGSAPAWVATAGAAGRTARPSRMPRANDPSLN